MAISVTICKEKRHPGGWRWTVTYFKMVGRRQLKINHNNMILLINSTYKNHLVPLFVPLIALSTP